MFCAAAIAFCVFGSLAPVAQSQTLPSMRFERADLVSLSAADSFYGSSTTRTSSFTGVSGFEGRPPEIVEQARALNNDVDRIYEYVRNHIRVEFAFGLRKGALGALIDRSGTAFDQNVLFVELVRQAGYTARYRIGTAQLTPAQFTDWTGITNGPSACRMLAFGGIPAAFDGSSPANCAVASALGAVHIRHVWSEVQVGGTWYAYDPSFKPHQLIPQRNLATDSGFMTGGAVTQAATGLVSGTQSGAPYIRDANDISLDAYLTARSTQLLGDIEQDVPAADMRAIIGGKWIEPFYAPQAGYPSTATPYTSTALYTITGDIPDQYRTSLTVSATPLFGTINRQLWADEIYGRRLEFDSNFDSEHIDTPDDYYDVALHLKLDDVALNTVSHNCPTPLFSSGCMLPSFVYTAAVAVNHPYAASSGAYADQSASVLVDGGAPVAIVHGWGRTSPDLAARWGRERAEDQAFPNRVAGTYQCDPEWQCNPTTEMPAGDLNRQRMGASWLAQFSRMSELQAEVGQSEIQLHHHIGFVHWVYDWVTYDPSPSEGPLDFGISDQQLVINLNTSVSVSSRIDDAARTRAVSRSLALTSAMFEGSIVEQMQDLPDSASTTARFAWGNRPDDEDPCSGGRRRFYDYTGTSSTTMDSLILFEGLSSGCTSSPNITAWSRTNAKDGYRATMQAYLAQGYQVTGSSESFLGPGHRVDACEPFQANCPGTHDAGRYRGGAFVANRFDAGGEVLEVAHVVLLAGEPAKGGGAGERSSSTYDPRRAGDVLKDRFVDRSSALGVDLKSGAVGYTTPTLLSAGAGDGAPYRLDYNLTFQPGALCTGRFGPCVGPAQGGWTHNWDIHFSLSGSALEAMGETTPLAATDAIIAVIAMQDTFLQSGLDNLRKDVYAALIADWWRRRMIGNVATVTRGFQGQQYLRRADNTWQAPIGSPGVLTQTGSRTKVRDVCTPNPGQNPAIASSARRWDGAGVSFSLRHAGGDVMAFSPWAAGYSLNLCEKIYGFALGSWTWPQGPSLTFTHSEGKVQSVQSSLGRTLHPNAASMGGRTAGISGPGNSVITNSAGATQSVSYSPGVARSATQRPRPFMQIHRISEFVPAATPVVPGPFILEYTYDSLGRVREAKDGVALQQGGRGPYEFFIAERARGQRLDPAGGRFTVFFDQDGNAIRHIDELAREVFSEYDGRHRVVRRTYPEDNFDEFTYDSRDNILSISKYPKPGGGAAITLSATYNPTWNRIATLTDGRGNTTTFTYHASGNGAAQLATVVRPAVGGQSPTYSFLYNAIGLVTQETDPTGRVTTHGYDGAGNRTSTTIGVAAIGGPALNLSTTFTPNTWGDVVTVLDPRGNAVTTDYDTMRRPTVVRRHGGGTGATLLAAGETIYDASGQVVQQKAGTAFSGTSVTTWQTLKVMTYTPTGKLATETNGDNETTEYKFDALDRPQMVIDPVGRRTATVYNLAGEVLCTWRGWNSSTPPTNCTWNPASYTGTGPVRYAEFTYTPNGQRASVKDANNNVTLYGFDFFDRLRYTRFPHPSSGTHCSPGQGAEDDPTCSSGQTFERLLYDANGNVTALKKRDGRTIAFVYDVLDRETRKHYPNGGASEVHRLYDLAGRPDSVRFDSTSGPGIVYTHDAAGRLTSETSFGRTVSFGFDAASNRTQVMWPDANYIRYNADPLNRVDRICENTATCTSGGLVSYTLTPLSLRDAIARGNGSASDLDYDPAQRLSLLTHDVAGSDQDLTRTFGYTNAGQLNLRSNSNDDYEWEIPPLNRLYVANGLNQYASVDSTAHVHDLNGNLTSDGSRTFGYDIENRLLSVAGSASLTLTYDPLGRLKSTAAGGTTTEYLYEGDRLIAEYQGSTMLRRYAHGPGIDEPVVWYEGSGLSDKRWLHADERGSIVATSTANPAEPATIYTYGPYGEPGAPQLWTGSRFRYTGQIALLETGVQLYHYKARVYDPNLGRFLQTDPVGYEDDFNLYAYVGNDPLNRTDPTGLKCQTNADTNSSSCTIDVFRDKNGKQITREQATQGRNGRAIKKLEARLTSKYDKAKQLAAKGGSVTIKGDSKLKISDQKVSGSQIVAAMESVDLTAAAGPNPARSDSVATTTSTVFSDGSVQTAGTTFWNNGRTSTEQTFGHETLHGIYTKMVPPVLDGQGGAKPSGWDALPNEAHQSSFENAADQIR